MLLSEAPGAGKVEVVGKDKENAAGSEEIVARVQKI